MGSRGERVSKFWAARMKKFNFPIATKETHAEKWRAPEPRGVGGRDFFRGAGEARSVGGRSFPVIRSVFLCPAPLRAQI